GGPDVGLSLRGYVTYPGARPDDARPLVFRQTAPGTYEAKFKAEEAGSYFIDAAAVVKGEVKARDGKEEARGGGGGSVRAGVTIPYSPEFSDMEANTSLLEKLRELTDGKAYPDDEEGLAEAAASGEVFRPGKEQARSLQQLWYWLVFATAVLLL